jgi:hypothetical protein
MVQVYEDISPEIATFDLSKVAAPLGIFALNHESLLL